MKSSIILCFLLAYAACAQSGHFHGNRFLETNDDMALGAEAEAETTENIPGLCQVCKLVFSGVKATISDDDTQEEVQNKLINECKKVGFLKRMCKSMIKIYLPILVDELMEGVSAKTACTTIKLCKKKTTSNPSHP